MKKVLFLLAAVMMAVPAIADEYRVNVGLKAGLAMYNIITSGGDESQSGDMKAGLLGGFFVDFPFNDNSFSLGTEMTYIQKGDSESGATNEIDYLQIPLLFRAYITPKSEAKLYVVLGAAPNFLLGATQTVNGQSTDVKDDVNGVDGSLIGGIGVDVDHFRAEFRVDGGLSDIGKYNGSLNQSTLGFDLAVGYNFK